MDIKYATHQCARFPTDPRQSHGATIKYLTQYLLATRSEGLIFSPKPECSFDMYVGPDFAGRCYRPKAEHDVYTAKFRMGYMILFAGCPMVLSSKLRTLVALSTTEAEYMLLSVALQAAIPLMGLTGELRSTGLLKHLGGASVYCRAFEGNSGALEMARLPKMRPRTKHINISYHHFREHMQTGKIQIFPNDAKWQVANILTQPLLQNDFQ